MADRATSSGDAPRPTLRDVAANSGVAFSTVSRILRGRTEGYREETVERVRVAAAEVGYRPNVQARALRLRRHHVIAILVPDLDNFGFTEVLRGIQQTCHQRGYTMLISEVREEQGGTEPVLPDLAGAVDGVLAAFAAVDDEGLSGYLEKAIGVPTVFVQRGVPQAAATAVLDEHRNVAMMVEHLAGLGHTAIAHVSGSLRTDTGVRRHQGFEAAMSRHGVPVPQAWRRDGQFTFAGGRAAAEELFDPAAAEWPTAVAVDSLVTALGVLSVLRERGLGVPGDISVVTIDEHVVAQQTTPPLTTVKVPQRALGNAAASMLLDMIDGGSGEQIVIDEPSELILRESTAPPRTHRLPARPDAGEEDHP